MSNTASTTGNTIHQKLVLIQSKLKAPKSLENKHFGYKYRSCEDVVEAVKPLAHEHGCAVLLSDEVVEICGRAYVKATASLTDGQGIISVTGQAGEPIASSRMDASQCTGSASTYARKRALDGLFAIDDTKDPDTQSADEKAPPKPVAKAAAAKAPIAQPKAAKAPPTVVKVMEMLTACKKATQLEVVWKQAMTYQWGAADLKKLDDCKTNCLKNFTPAA